METTDNQEVLKTVSSIRRLIVASMDGVTAQLMAEKGVEYERNYGVALPRLREIARQFEPNEAVATKLHEMPGRENLLVSMMLMPLTVEESVVDEWASNLPTQEAAEVMAMCLTSKLPYACRWASKLVNSDNRYCQLTALHTLVRVVDSMNDVDCQSAIERVTQSEVADNFAAVRMQAILLAKICVKCKKYTDNCRQWFEHHKTSTYIEQLVAIFDDESAEW